MSDAVKVDGLTQFVKRLKEIDPALPKMARKAMNQGADLVVSGVRPLIPSRTGRARNSLKVASAQDRVRVKAGGTRAPHYPWLDYGGEGRKRGRPSARPFIKAGRYIYPVYFKKRDSGEFTALMTAALQEVVEAAGIEVT